MAKDPRKMTPMERREKMIKDRANRLAKDAAKQGITPEQLMKKKKDTYVNVVGGAALGALPVGAVLRGAGALFKGLSGGAKAAKTASKATKAAPKAKPAAKKPAATSTKTAAKKQPAAKKPAAKKTESVGTKAKKLVAATTGVGAQKGRRSGMAIRGKDGRVSGVSKKTQETGKRLNTALKGGAAASVALATADAMKKKEPGTATAKSGGGQTFAQAFAAARKKGVGTPFTYKGKKFTAVRDTDIPKSITGTKAERLRKFMNKRKQNKNLQKGKGK